jgi:hypothetical protein
MANGSGETSNQAQPAGAEANGQRDWRAVIVAGAGLAVILIGGAIAIIALPGAVPSGETNNSGQNIVAIASAAFSAVAAVVSAYFGVKAANVAREEGTKAAERSQIRAVHLAAASPEDADVAEQAAAQSIQAQGLEAG